MNDRQLRVKFGPEYYHKMNTDPALLNPADILDFDVLIEWLLKFKPGAAVHLSGGEPLLRPDIEDQTEKLLNAGFDVSILTNGQAIHKRPRLLDMPVKWLAAYHQDSISLVRFIAQIEPLRTRKHLIVSVCATVEHAKAIPQMQTAFTGFNFQLRWNKNAQRNTAPLLQPGDLDTVASQQIHLITPNGAVYPCNSCKYGFIGDIYTGDYDLEKAQLVDPYVSGCVKNNGCQAYQTAVIMNGL